MKKSKWIAVHKDEDATVNQLEAELRNFGRQTNTPQKLTDLLSDELVSNCEKGNITVVKKLLQQGADPNAIKNHGIPLCAATRSPFPNEIINLLLAAGANPSHEEYPGWHPLFCAAGNNRVDAMKVLIETGADLNQRCSCNGWTPLMNAACLGHVECVVELLALKADTTIKSMDGLTAIDIAKGNGHEQVLRAFQRYLEIRSKG